MRAFFVLGETTFSCILISKIGVGAPRINADCVSVAQLGYWVLELLVESLR